MKRHILFGLLIIVLQSAAAQDRPNIIWLMAEDISLDIGCYGMEAVQTPILDKMAKEGVRFDNCFVTNSICSPSRSSMMVGTHQTKINAHNHRSNRDVPLDENYQPFTHHLRKAGYTTILGHHGVMKKGRKTDVNFKSEQIGKWDGKTKFGLFDKYDNFEKEDQPFFAQIQLVATHRGDWWDEVRANSLHPVNPEEVFMPPYMADNPVVRLDWAKYLDQMEFIDAEIGMIFGELQQKGMADNTVVIFIGDNGRCNIRGKGYLHDPGMHIPFIVYYPKELKGGQVRKDVVSATDITATILDFASVDVPAYMTGKPVFENNSRREYVYGTRDLWDEVEEQSRALTSGEWKYIRNDKPEIPFDAAQAYLEFYRPAVHVMRTLNKEGKLNEAQQFFFNKKKPIEELYDLKNDPHELNNLAENKIYNKQIEKLRKELIAQEIAMKPVSDIYEPVHPVAVDVLNFVKVEQPIEYKKMQSGVEIGFKKALVTYKKKALKADKKRVMIGDSPNHGWKFKKLSDKENDENYHLKNHDISSWSSVSLPHTANIEPLIVNDQWQGISWYRQSVFVPKKLEDKKVILEWEGAMHVADIFINGQFVEQHIGGYLPIVIDASPYLEYGKENLIAIRLDNQDNPLTGPKPLAILDFNMYGGLYREHNVIIKDKIYISHPNLSKKVAGGGLLITTPKVNKESATVSVQSHVINEYEANQNAFIRHTISYDGEEITQTETKLKPKRKNKRINVYLDLEVTSNLTVANPNLWSPQHPHLYHLKSEVLIDGFVVDTQLDRFGIRQFEFKGMDLYINGEQTFLRGVNRHQEYPFIGYALSDNAQYRDAKKIKDAGFDYIRLSHYPHSPAFMDACDELGLIVTDAILGWQYYKDDDRFRDYCYNSTRQLIRRDRNHACVLLWEASLNETAMPDYFMEMLNAIVHHELPGENTYTAGWMDYAYDVFFQARQHKIKHHDRDRKYTKPYAVSEYGDWEYYSNNAGLNQDKLDKTLRFETSSRQQRGFGEARLLNQLNNLHESHNDNFTTPAFADSYWVMYDYNRGYHSDIEFSGISDIFRIEKFAYYFYKSQRSQDEEVVLKLATYWTEDSPTDVKVLSNCDEVELFLNDKLIARQKPDTDKKSTHLSHPPFTFKLGQFKSGELKAVGYINNKQVSESIVETPKMAVKLKLWLDESDKGPEAGVNDVLFLYIAAVDENGTIIPNFSEQIDLKIQGDFEVMNTNIIQAEAGIATALIRIGRKKGKCTIEAKSNQLSGAFRFETYKK